MPIFKNPLLGSLMIGFAVLCFATAAYAAPVTVTNSSSQSSAFVRTKTAAGQHGLQIVGPRQTLTLDETVERVRVNSADPSTVKVQTSNGKSFTLDQDSGHRAGQSILVKPSAPPVTIRTGNGVSVLPGSTAGENQYALTGDGYKFAITAKYDYQTFEGARLGVGTPPSPSDGPVEHVGKPLAHALSKNPSPGQPSPEAFMMYDDLDDADLAELDAMGYATKEEILDFLDTEMGFRWYYSGSGGMFGDCIGTNCVGYRNLGYPRLGPPVGASVSYDYNRTMISRDSVLADFLNNNFSAFKSQFENLYGDFAEDLRGNSLAG